MALYRVTLFKRIPDQPTIKPWSNVYYTDVADLGDALDSGETLADFEITILKEYVQVFKIHAVQPFVGAASGASKAVDFVGAVTGDPALMLPLFNTVRILMTDEVHRPSMKYFRCPLQEDEIENGTLISAFVDDVQDNYCTPLNGYGNLRSNSGDEITDIRVVPDIQMRQTNWHRRTRPGFKRGWVPE